MAIEKVVWKGTFEEAEERDNNYWAHKTVEERLQALIELRQIFFANNSGSIERIIRKRKLHDEADF